MVALRVALVIAWIVAQVVCGLAAVLMTHDGYSAPVVALPTWIAAVAVPGVLGGSGIWLAARTAHRRGTRAEAWAITVPLALLIALTVLVFRAMA